MALDRHRQTDFAPRAYPEPNDNNRPQLPPRMEFQEEPFLPKAPRRMDIEEQKPSCSKGDECNYNRYATKKTVGHGLLGIALFTSNVMQLRTLSIQKQRDGIWVASLVLVCLSIIAQIILACILVIVGKGDIRNPEKQGKLEKYNNLSLFLTTLISMINVVINGLMTTTSPTNYFDASISALLANHT